MNRLYHTGVIVLNLEAAIAAYSRSLGLEFRTPLVRSFARVEQRDSDQPAIGRMTYSTTGPFFVELLEISGPGLWEQQRAENFHHIGMWSDNPLRQARQMASTGFEWEASIHGADGSIPVVFVRRGDARIELVTETRRKAFEEWVSGLRKEP